MNRFQFVLWVYTLSFLTLVAGKAYLVEGNNNLAIGASVLFILNLVAFSPYCYKKPVEPIN